MTLARLLVRARVSRYKRTLFFGGCDLKGTVLLVPDADRAASLTRLYGETLQSVLPGLEIRSTPGLSTFKASYYADSPSVRPLRGQGFSHAGPSTRPAVPGLLDVLDEAPPRSEDH